MNLQNIKLDIDKIPGKVSLISDMWTSTLNNNSFLVFTIHFIDQEWKMQHFLLDIISFNEWEHFNGVGRVRQCQVTR